MPPSVPVEFSLRIDAGQCVGCAICVDICHTRALLMGPQDLRPLWVAGPCTGCGDCQDQCPTGAIAGCDMSNMAHI